MRPDKPAAEGSAEKLQNTPRQLWRRLGLLLLLGGIAVATVQCSMSASNRPSDGLREPPPPPQLLEPPTLVDNEASRVLLGVELGGTIGPEDLPVADASVTLRNPNQIPFCSGVFIAPNLLLTASHCLDPQKRMSLWLKDNLLVGLENLGARSCMGGYCDPNAYAGSDLGMAHVRQDMNSYFDPGVYNGNDFPPMILLASGSNGVPNPRVVCKAWRHFDQGMDSKTLIDDGDSGGALVTILANEKNPEARPSRDEVIVLGVASAKNGGSILYFTPIPSSLPPFDNYPGILPSVRPYNESTKYRKLKGCSQ